jgi:hypothetical protein
MGKKKEGDVFEEARNGLKVFFSSSVFNKKLAL